MSSLPTITVAIPSYNKEGAIQRCLTSVLKNANDIDRIILVDNCSTDQTFSIAQAYEPAVTCYRNDSNVGMAGNFNRCIELCDTDWLLIFHADDEMLPDAIAAYRKVILQHPSVALIHADCHIQEEGKASSTYCPRSSRGFFKAGIEALQCHYGACSSIMVKRSVYTRLGGFLESMSCDVEMWARIAGQYDIYSLDVSTVIYHVSQGSTGPQSLVNRSIREIQQDWNNLNEHILDAFTDPHERELFQRKLYKDGPGNYWPVFTANVRAKNWRNVLGALKVIVIDYRGMVPLIRFLARAVVKRVTTH